MPRLSIQKTYKLFIGGKFPRTESGHYYPLYNKQGKLIANMCMATRKDLKSAVAAARKAQDDWQNKTAYNRGQVLYRLAEMLETRKTSFIGEMKQLGFTKKAAEKETEEAIDRLVYYAGWCDKYTALFSAVNPVASNHFSFSVHEPTGVAALVAPEESPLLGLISTVAPAIAGGNTTVVLASESRAVSAVSFAEVVQNSDVPAGVVNVLTGSVKDLLPHMASHMDIDALVIARKKTDGETLTAAINNVKRLVDWSDKTWGDARKADPYMILDLQEVKTTWHPVQVSAQAGSGY